MQSQEDEGHPSWLLGSAQAPTRPLSVGRAGERGLGPESLPRGWGEAVIAFDDNAKPTRVKSLEWELTVPSGSTHCPGVPGVVARLRQLTAPVHNRELKWAAQGHPELGFESWSVIPKPQL